ncbi:MAG: hypothetical protein M3Z54_01910 [Gemmatimonadota bacterium]|nr:hypothetical protein [Gemmatimonadota bacterium]
MKLTTAYLTQPDSSARSRGLWSTQSAFDARYGDLAQEAYQGFPATILGVSGNGLGDSVFVVKVIHATADSTRKRITPLAMQRFYAIRASGSPYGWQLSSPLPRLTHDWARRDAGGITFWYAPGQRQSPDRAKHASKFVDSVARLFGVSPPKHLDAYVTGTMDDGERLLGLDFLPENSGPGTGFGGRGGGDGILLLSDPRVGEAYLHELVHAVIGPTVESRNSIFGEGVAVWLGGSGERSLKQMYSFLGEYQRAHPEVSLAEMFGGEPPGGYDAVVALYATRGLIVDSIYRRSGIEGLRRFAQIRGSPSDMIKILPSYTNVTGGDINHWWRTETEAALRR